MQGINGTVLYPGAGMALMALEAAKQLCRDGRQISAFTLQDTSLQTPIQIPESEYVETSFCMKPLESMNGKDSDWYQFSLYTRVASSWIRNCTGTIQVQYDMEEPERVGGGEKEHDAAQVDLFLKAQAKCTSSVDMDLVYSHLRTLGYDYGDTFKGIQSISLHSPDYGTLISEITNNNATADSTVHPTAVDAMLQIGLCSATECGTKDIPTCVPTFIGRLWIAADGHPTASETFKCLSEGIFQPEKGLLGPSIVFGPEVKAPIIVLEGLECSVVSGGPSKPQEESTCQLSSEIEWKPDLRLMDNSSLEKLFEKQPLTELIELLTQLDFVLLARVLEALHTFSEQDIQPKKPYMRKYLAWAKEYKARLDRGELNRHLPQWTKRLQDWEYIHSLENQLLENPKVNKLAGLSVSVGRNLIDLLGDTIDPLQFFFSTDILEDYYGYSFDMSNMAPWLTASERFAKEGDRMSFKVLNIENDPEPQGFECGSYDVVLAVAVLHATQSLEKSLHNTRRLLKPGGKVIILEVVNPFRSAAIFGLIEGWWLSTEPYRSSGPCVGRSRWHDLLLETGFSGCDSFAADFENSSAHEMAIIISAAVDNTPAPPTQKTHIEIIYDPADSSQDTVARSIEQELKTSPSLSVTCSSLEAACTKNTDLIRVFLLEYGKPVIYNLDKRVFKQLQDLLITPTRALWDESFLTPRLINSDRVDRAVSLQVIQEHQGERKFGSGIPLQLDTKKSSLMSGFKFVESDSIDTLGDKQAELEIKYVGLNFRDVLMALGQPLEGQIGQEASGVITRVGHGCTRFKKGDLVTGIPLNCMATHSVINDESPVTKIPEGCSLSTAASVPVNFMTAYFAVKEIARIQPGESILIHSGAGGTGQAAIQLAQHFGANIFTTVGTQEKKQFLIEQYHIPEDQIFSSRSTSFEQAIMRRTYGKGVDVVLNALAGEALIKSWDCIAAHGRFVEIGKKDIMANNKLPMKMFLKNVSYTGFDLAFSVQQRPSSTLLVLETIMRLLAEGSIQPPQPISLFGLGDMSKAFRLMQSGKNHGKFVIEMRPDDMVTTVLKSQPNSSFDEHATYLIAGGLGGLGQSMIKWLVSRGARNLLVLSRSGERKTEVRTALDKLRSEGINILAPECDVSDEDSVQTAVKESSRLMPPIRGCIQAAMVLDDMLFEDMSHENWQTAVRPKVQGSWNLHQYLPQGLDFFIMLSSLNGITGIQGQPNYAVGNTFQDALAHYRVSQGQNGTSLDIGLITFTGRVARDAKLLAKVLASYPQEPVTEPQFHATLDSYCNPAAARHMGLTCQPSVGINPREGAASRQYWLDKPLLQYLALKDSSQDNQKTQGQGIDLAGALQQAHSLAEAADHVTKALSSKLSTTLSIDVGELEADKPLHQYGVDSLVAVEIRTWFTRGVGGYRYI
ncbi:hypothetical protein FE257_012480 [Aspergillus nanangensis]|uniref:Carrier domain-containing protein n=1 Tax=Aspergillus nanangensis TaxID=2582783 RepID=A0AAD4GWR8_ASPNN|nr:hypothetical protein FE257_012480 [Aspergillus nanangensis]